MSAVATDDAMRSALALHQHGDLAGARAAYLRILERQPAHSPALQYLGVLAGQLGDHASALRLIGQATEISPDNALMHFHLGAARHRAQLLTDAVDSYSRATELKPDLAEAWLNRGVLRCELGQREAALGDYTRAIALQPTSAAAFSNRGDLLRELGRVNEALADCDEALRLNPAFALAHFNRGLVLAALNRPEEALRSYDRAIAIDGGYVEAYFHRGDRLQALGRLPEALESFDAALRLKPDHAKSHLFRGEVMRRLGQLEAALVSYDALLRLAPDTAEVHFNRGCVLQQMRRFAEAQESFASAIAIRPQFGEAFSNRAIVLREMGQLDAALACHDEAVRLSRQLADPWLNRGVALQYSRRWHAALADYERAIELDPDHGGAHYNKALLLLQLGDFERGWAEHEWRWKNASGPLFKRRREFACPLWLGEEPLAGKTILLHGEQGFGDSIQFCRYVTPIAALGATVHLEVPAAVVRLLRSVEGISTCLARGESLPAADFHCPLMSLPLALRTTLETIPAKVPYLRAEREKVRAWRERLGETARLRVGLVWSGGFRPDQPEVWAVNQRRNIPLEMLAPLKNPAIEFYSLQKGEPAEAELASLRLSGWNGPELIDLAASITDFSDTAALIENLDLVISVDTSTAHVAGALGKPVWILSRYDSCWRWLLERVDSPWYPTVRLYRQPAAGNWNDVVARVRADLMSAAHERPGSLLRPRVPS